MKKFICKWDWLNVVVSIIIAVFTILAPFAVYAAIQDGRYFSMIIPVVFYTLGIIGCYKALYRCPISLELDEQILMINYIIGSEELRLDELTAAKADKDFSIMNFISEGYFSSRPCLGYWGNFHNSKGKFRFCFTHRKQDLWILTLKGDERKLIINAPADWFNED